MNDRGKNIQRAGEIENGGRPRSKPMRCGGTGSRDNYYHSLSEE